MKETSNYFEDLLLEGWEARDTTKMVAELSRLAVQRSKSLESHVGCEKAELRRLKKYERRSRWDWEVRQSNKRIKGAREEQASFETATRNTFGPNGALTPKLIEAALAEYQVWNEDKSIYDTLRSESASRYQDITLLASETLTLPEDASPFKSISSLYRSLQAIKQNTDAPYIREVGTSMVVDGYSIGLYKPFTSTYKMDAPQLQIIPTRFTVVVSEGEFARLGVSVDHESGYKGRPRPGAWCYADFADAHSEPKGTLDEAALRIATYDAQNGFNDSNKFDKASIVINGWSGGKKPGYVEVRRANQIAKTIPFGYFNFDDWHKY